MKTIMFLLLVFSTMTFFGEPNNASAAGIIICLLYFALSLIGGIILGFVRHWTKPTLDINK